VLKYKHQQQCTTELNAATMNKFSSLINPLERLIAHKQVKT